MEEHVQGTAALQSPSTYHRKAANFLEKTSVLAEKHRASRADIHNDAVSSWL